MEHGDSRSSSQPQEQPRDPSHPRGMEMQPQGSCPPYSQATMHLLQGPQTNYPHTSVNIEQNPAPAPKPPNDYLAWSLFNFVFLNAFCLGYVATCLFHQGMEMHPKRSCPDYPAAPMQPHRPHPYYPYTSVNMAQNPEPAPEHPTDYLAWSLFNLIFSCILHWLCGHCLFHQGKSDVYDSCINVVFLLLEKVLWIAPLLSHGMITSD
uniref:Uncharacterized protein n=1 Tax=Eptatretus burgeri TaxID=7764 RepID=A0A8C4QXA9_EPTBU